MTSTYRKIVLCKGQSENNDSQEKYVTLFKSAGYVCDCLSTLRFEFVNLKDLRKCLLTPQSFSGLVLTSRRAVEAISLAVKEQNDLCSWKTLPVYCVGPATESCVKDSLSFDQCLGSECGNAKELAKKIVLDLCNESRPLLYPCSEIARDTIEETLKSQSLKVQKVVVYRTLPSHTLEKDLSRVFLNNTSMTFVFFSPSTVEYIIPLLKQHEYDKKDVKAVAIGPVTEQALMKVDYDVYAVAGKPEPQSLLEAIVEADQRQTISN